MICDDGSLRQSLYLIKLPPAVRYWDRRLFLPLCLTFENGHSCVTLPFFKREDGTASGDMCARSLWMLDKFAEELIPV